MDLLLGCVFTNPGWTRTLTTWPVMSTPMSFKSLSAAVGCNFQVVSDYIAFTITLELPDTAAASTFITAPAGFFVAVNYASNH